MAGSCEVCGRPLSEPELTFGVIRCAEHASVRPDAVPTDAPPGPAGSLVPGAPIAPDVTSPGIPGGDVVTNVEGAVAPLPADYADSWPRVGAYVIDYVVAGVLATGAAVAIAVVASVVAVLVGDFAFQEDEDRARSVAVVIGVLAATLGQLFYFWFGNSWGGTPGKRMVGLSVVDARAGGEIGLARGFARLIIQILGAIPLYLGWLWSIWDGQKQAWHDKGAGSVVVARLRGGQPARPWYRGWVPLAAGGVTACLVLGIVGGLVTGLALERDTNERLNELFSQASDAYVRQAERQANIDSLYSRCSPEWVDETAVNSARSLQSVIGLSDYAAARDEISARTEQFCADSDIGAYCVGLADAVAAWAAADDVDKRSVEDGCLQRFESELAAQTLKVGDCILYIGASYDVTECSRPHDAEIVAVFEMPDDGAGYPGEEAVDDYAFENCPVETVLYLYPTSSTWDAGDREIACAVEEP